MKKLLNTLYITSEDSYVSLDGENVVVSENGCEKGRVPLHNLEGIVSFGYKGTSPALMGACADRNISLCYLSPQGKFLARVSGKKKLQSKKEMNRNLGKDRSMDVVDPCCKKLHRRKRLWTVLYTQNRTLHWS